MKQQRNTRQRKMVLDTVWSEKTHPTADEIYLKMRKCDSQISRGTVYRNLHLLAENGEISHVHMPGADRFDWRMEPHYHMVCTVCGKVADVPVPYREELDPQISALTGYRISRHAAVFEGVCPECQKKQQDDGLKK